MLLRILSLGMVLFLAACAHPAAPPAAPSVGTAGKVASPQKRHALTQLRAFLRQHHYTFNIGITSKIGAPIASVTGAIRERLKEREALSAPHLDSQAAREIAARPAFDARADHIISPVQDQGRCGTCSVFAVVGLLETATAIARHEKIAASEQDIINCYPDSCKGDVRVSRLLHFLKTSGTAPRAQVPYTKSAGTCSDKLLRCFHLRSYGYVDDSVEVPDAHKIKLAVATYGAVISWMYATDLFEAYTGSDVFYEHVDPKRFEEGDSKTGGGHEVLIVGWDDERTYGHGRKGAWLVKNSWGTDWGDRGFAWIAYGSNAIGTEARWATVSPERTPGCAL